MRRILSIVLTTFIACQCYAYTLDTSHELYSNMKGIYVFDDAVDGNNIAGDGVMVGTTEDANGFATPITQSFQDWHNSFGSAYTVCLWHSGMTMGTWGRIFEVSDDTFKYYRNSSYAWCKNYHNGNGYVMSDLLVAELADEMMFSMAWSSDVDTMLAYDDSTLIGSTACATSPKTTSTTSEIIIDGSTTVTRLYIFDALLTTTQLAALSADPDSIFVTEGGSTVPPLQINHARRRFDCDR